MAPFPPGIPVSLFASYRLHLLTLDSKRARLLGERHGVVICEWFALFVTILIFYSRGLFFFGHGEWQPEGLWGQAGKGFAGWGPGSASLDTSGKLQHPGGALQGRTACDESLGISDRSG